jgi:hypothetical protein
VARSGALAGCAPSRSDSGVTLDEEDIEAIAARVARLISATRPSGLDLLDPKELAAELRISVDYVYAHAADLGAMRLGDGPKARLRFDLHAARQAIGARKQPPKRMGARR